MILIINTHARRKHIAIFLRNSIKINLIILFCFWDKVHLFLKYIFDLFFNNNYNNKIFHFIQLLKQRTTVEKTFFFFKLENNYQKKKTRKT